MFAVGDRVQIDSIDGFGGPATIVEVREDKHARYKVQMEDSNPSNQFWAWNEEVSGSLLHDSRSDTRAHIREVQRNLALVTSDLARRALVHDQSKLESPEVEIFDEFTGKLKGTTYGSDQYKSYLAAMKPALDHHYAANTHHPEHWPHGIRDMSLLDILEMLCDWGASCKRHDDGSIRRSIEINQRRFGYSDELKQILLNTLPVIETT